ncbi:ATP-dependent helicase [Psychrobacter lutiphocae]|uniref:ATP-dependent helicase n=1 Tax=Psychrobacter lutiphocae TaxID=540500 RepID=UPI00037431DD|nr:ATP-dependent helicase [Psychrobacter lutiphocae]
MTDTVFDLAPYSYPQLHSDIKDKMRHLRQSIDRLEANLITPQSLAEDAAQHSPAVKTGSTADYLNELNPSQRLAATTIEGKALVIAGAGSGKTKTLTYRTSYLIEQGADPRQILLLTFTRKAANEIKGRVKSLLSEDLPDGKNINDITSGTFHSFCNMLLRRYSNLLGISAKFTILDTGDSEDAIDLISKEKGYSKRHSEQAFPRKARLQKIISASRNRHILIHDLIATEYPDLSVHADAINQLAEDYHKYKRAHHLYDFDDIISQVVRHLKNNVQFRKILQDTYRYVMVDEYQDTNIPQKQLIDYICQPKQVSLMVVGDDNQSIYAFRGANYENILLFSDSYPDAKLIKLEQNYRSTPAILDYVNALSDQITFGYQKRLFSTLPTQGQKPQFCRRSDEAAEAKYIADKLIELKPDHDYNDFAVLGRTSFQSSHVQLEFIQRGIPFIVVGGIKFLEKRHIKDVLALVKILHNPNDTIAWHRILTLFKGVGQVTATKLTQAILQQNSSLQPLLDPKLNKKSEQLIELYQVLTKAEQADTVAEMIDVLLDFYTPVLQALEDNWRERAEDFRVLKNLAQEHSSIERFLESLALDPPNDSVATFDNTAPEDKDAVTISTIHSAKGLEWPVVFINALIDGMMPHRHSIDDFEALEEERKLFYVACSRAKTHLYLTAPHYFASFAGYFDKVSRFISEVPADTIELASQTQQQVKDGYGKQKEQKPDWW